ncbi:MAG: ABC transporter ATP-binding protein [Planctomycetota bacterium]
MASPTLADLLSQPEPPSASAPPLLVAEDLFKTYRKGPVGVPVLQGVNLTVRQGEFVAVIGQSGSGKSTLLHLLGTLDRPDSGEVRFEGNRIDNLPAAGRDILRNRHIGMIFQAYHLMPELSALENVLAPAMIRFGVMSYLKRRRQIRRRGEELLERVGLGHRCRHKPREMSGGEMQRVAIARSLMSCPRLLLADEPTGNLDRENGDEVLKLLGELHRDEQLTVVMVTHDPQIAARADRTVTLASGKMQAAGAQAA